MKNAVKSFPLGNSEIFPYSRPLNEHLKIWKEDYSISVIICLETNKHVERI
jgi:hypothetical protein